MGAPELVAAGLPPQTGTFLDARSFQRDALARREMLREVECWVFEHRQHDLVLPERTAVDGVARTAPEARPWASYLLELDAAGEPDRGVRCVRVVPLSAAVQGEVHTLCQAGVQVRVVDAARAARSLLPEVLVLGDRCAYVLVRGEGALVGAVHVSDPQRVRRWSDVLYRLYTRGSRLDPGTTASAWTRGEA